MPEELFAPQIQRLIEYYIDTRDPDKSSCLVRLDPKKGRAILRQKSVRAEIDRRIAIEDKELAHLRASARKLIADKLDTELEKAITKEKGYAKVRALELGYRRLGIIREGEFVGETKPQQEQRQNLYGSIYRAIGTTAIRRTTTEEVLHTQEIAASSAPEPVQISAQPQELPKPAIEILEY